MKEYRCSKRLINSVLILLILCFITGCRSKYTHEDEIFQWYMEKLHVEIPETECLFILIPDISCIGCENAVIRSIYLHPDKKTILVVSKSIQEKNELIGKMPNVIIDQQSLLNQLNWKYVNIIEIKTRKKQVYSVRDYDSSEIDLYFK